MAGLEGMAPLGLMLMDSLGSSVTSLTSLPVPYLRMTLQSGLLAAPCSMASSPALLQ